MKTEQDMQLNQTTMNVCDDGTGQATFDLTTLNVTVDGGGGNAVLWYTDGTLGTQIVPDNAFLTGDTTIYAQVTDGVTGCTDTASITLTVDPLPTAINLTLTPCEDVLGGQSVAGVDLTLNEASIDGGAGNTMTWYSNATLTTLVVPPTNVTVNNGDVFHVLVDNGTCTDTAMVSYTVTGTITLTNPNDSLCEDAAGIGSVSGVDLTSYNSTIFTKSGLMVGLGEDKDELIQVMDDLRSADVDFLTIGQYLQPSVKHHPLSRYYHPDEFKDLENIAKSKGFLLVSSSPLTRSSYHADEDFAKLQKNRLENQNAQSFS